MRGVLKDLYFGLSRNFMIDEFTTKRLITFHEMREEDEKISSFCLS